MKSVHRIFMRLFVVLALVALWCPMVYSSDNLYRIETLLVKDDRYHLYVHHNQSISLYLNETIQVGWFRPTTPRINNRTYHLLAGGDSVVLEFFDENSTSYLYFDNDTKSFSPVYDLFYTVDPSYIGKHSTTFNGVYLDYVYNAFGEVRLFTVNRSSLELSRYGIYGNYYPNISYDVTSVVGYGGQSIWWAWSGNISLDNYSLMLTELTYSGSGDYIFKDMVIDVETRIHHSMKIIKVSEDLASGWSAYLMAWIGSTGLKVISWSAKGSELNVSSAITLSWSNESVGEYDFYQKGEHWYLWWSSDIEQNLYLVSLSVDHGFNVSNATWLGRGTSLFYYDTRCYRMIYQSNIVKQCFPGSVVTTTVMPSTSQENITSSSATRGVSSTNKDTATIRGVSSMNVPVSSWIRFSGASQESLYPFLLETPMVYNLGDSSVIITYRVSNDTQHKLLILLDYQGIELKKETRLDLFIYTQGSFDEIAIQDKNGDDCIQPTVEQLETSYQLLFTVDECNFSNVGLSLRVNM